MTGEGGGTRRLVLLSGASRGLGAALAAGWRRDGWRVLTLSRSCPAGTAPGDWILVDLAEPVAAAGRLAEALAGIDPAAVDELIVLHNAATLEPLGPVERAPAAALAAGLQTNLVAGVTLLATAMAHFRASAGRKVVAHVSSGAALRSHAGLTVYGAAKAGMDHVIRGLAADEARQARPFLPVSLDPGALDTAMQQRLRDASPDEHPGAADFAQRHRTGQLGQVDAVAATLRAILASPRLQPGARHHVRDGVP